MTTPTVPSPSFEPDVDHEIAEAIRLSEMIRGSRIGRFPKAVQSAIHTAFAAHFRALMEFFHDRTPEPADWSKLPPETRNNVRYSQITGTGKNRNAGRWTLADLRRFRDAHKLVGHLAEERVARRKMRKEWGEQADWNLLKPKIKDFLRTVRTQPNNYRRARAAARKAGLV